jgi:aminoglycoside 6'-N-acetyltransferase I
VIERCASIEQRGWLPLRDALWPHSAREQHLSEMSSFLSSPQRYTQFVAYSSSDEPLGFVEASLRSDVNRGHRVGPRGRLP